MDTLDMGKLTITIRKVNGGFLITEKGPNLEGLVITRDWITTTNYEMTDLVSRLIGDPIKITETAIPPF